VNETLLLSLLTAVGGGGFAALIGALFARRKTSAEADMTVGDAWAKFVQQQSTEIADLRRDNSELKGELRAAQLSIAQLERRERDSIHWQATATRREEDLRSQLAGYGVSLEPLTPPPAARPENTRTTDPRGPRP
jgi:catalase (peroxidase I)